MTPFSIAILQLTLPNADNRGTIAHAIESAVARFPWVQMVLLPELASFGSTLAHAETLPGVTEQRYQHLARKLGIWLIPGSLYERHEGRVYNTSPVIDPQGAVVARYRKIFPFEPYELGVSQGTEVCVFDVPTIGRFGLSICYDQWFPEVSRCLAWRGAEVILHPTMTTTTDRAQELILAQANAITNQCFFVDVNNAGALGNGQSIIVGPDGDLLHQAGEQTEFIPITLDLDRVRHARRYGIKGLGQMMKSFRDTEVIFPCYDPAQRQSQALRDLGSLQLPSRP
jgi:predicted amidohydrolase